MFDVKGLECGYSFESERHFIKFLIIGLDKKNQEKLVETVIKFLKGILKFHNGFNR